MIGTALLEMLPVAVYTTDAQGRITFFNEAAADLWGCRPRVGIDQWCGSWRLYWPDGRPMAHDECPMAMTLKEGRPVRGFEAIAERPDGTRVRFFPYPTPLRDASGQLVGAINVLVDATERYQADLQSARLAAIVATSDDAIISKTLEGRITSWNVGATRIFGYQADEMIGQPITRIIPPELHPDEQQILARLRRGEHIDHYETVRVTKDGRLVDISLTVSPLHDKYGRVIGASKVARDITERKEAERLRRLLTAELNHRVKNTLSIVQAIATQSLRRAKSPVDFVSSFTGRVQALARAHDLLTQNKLQGADVMALVREQVLFGATDDHRISCSGPVLMLEAQAAVQLALVLHELATNARKYGALSVPNGRLTVQWELRIEGERSNLILEWKERGGPKVCTPKELGFGSTLIERTLSAHRGEVSMRYAAAGVTCRISLPLPQHVRPDFRQAAAASNSKAGPLLAAEGKPQGILHGRRVIILEDEPLVAMDLESTLTAAGCDVVGSAATLDKAKLIVAQAQCDVAVVDMNFAGINLAGQTVDELAAALAQKNIPLVLLTATGHDGIPARFPEAVVLNKPFSQDQLLAAMEILFRKGDGVVQLRRKSR
jgi:PAS domain S-box-containing protein